MTVQEIKQQLLIYQKADKRMFVSSSFQTHSIPLLHLLSRIDVSIDVLFINTGYHFPETLTFRDEVAAFLGLKVIDVYSHVPKSQQKDVNGQLYFVSDPDYCCFLNKTQPLDSYLREYDIWINGVRRSQTNVRKNMQMEQSAPHNSVRFHPMLEWTAKQIYDYRKLYNLPKHPLDQQGYQSIGCLPCTRKFDLNDERSARWFGMNKMECGLHTELLTKQ